jgi:hypothetical protein
MKKKGKRGRGITDKKEDGMRKTDKRTKKRTIMSSKKWILPDTLSLKGLIIDSKWG